LTFSSFYINLKAEKEETMKKALERVRLLLFGGVYLLGAYSFVHVGMKASNIAPYFTKLEMAFLLVVHFGLAATLAIAAINRIRTAFRKNPLENKPDDEDDDGDEDNID